MVSEAPLPLEQTDPEIAEFFQDICHKENPYGIQAVHEYDGGVAFQPAPVKVEKKVGRNDPCPCSSGKKYKKCCGRGK